MNFAYKIDTVETTPTLAFSSVEFDARSKLKSLFSNSTSFADTALGAKLDPLAFNLKNRVPGRATDRWGSAIPWVPEGRESLFRHGAAIQNSTPSSATKPMLGVILAAEPDDHYVASNLFSYFIVATGIDALLSKEASTLLVGARAAALAGDMRPAYEKVFRGLDILLRSAQWTQLGSQLEQMSSDDYPAPFAIGAARFASDAASRIPNWSAILGKLAETARKQKLDVTIAMRGLLRGNETSKGG